MLAAARTIAATRHALADKFRQAGIDSGEADARLLLAYALGRSLIFSDEAMIQEMRGKLVASGYRFDTVIENIVTSPQFLNKRGQDDLAER